MTPLTPRPIIQPLSLSYMTPFALEQNKLAASYLNESIRTALPAAVCPQLATARRAHLHSSIMRLVTRVALFIYLVHHVSATLGPATDAPNLTTVPSVDEYGRKCPRNFYGPTCAVPKCIKNDGRLTERHDGTYFCNCTSPYISGIHCEVYDCHGGRRIFDSNRCDCPEDFEGRFCQESIMRNMALNTLVCSGFGIILCWFIYETIKRRRLNRERDKQVEDDRRERERAREREFAQLERVDTVSMDEYVTGLTPVASPRLIRPYNPQNLPSLTDLPPQYYTISMPNLPPEYTP